MLATFGERTHFGRLSLFVGVLLLVGVACGGPKAAGPQVVDPNGGGSSAAGATKKKQMPRAGDACAPSSVASRAECAKRSIPPGNGSSPEGCKSDADCKHPSGTDGRCIKGAYGQLAPPRWRVPTASLLAGPPPPPPRSLCVYDMCHADRDCGAKQRCACGSGQGEERNGCMPLDACLSDRDCAKDNICMCAASGTANYCILGDCRTDKDCGSGFACDQWHCHTSSDKCRTNADCAQNPNGPASCSYFTESRRWECRVIPPVPPG